MSYSEEIRRAKEKGRDVDKPDPTKKSAGVSVPLAPRKGPKCPYCKAQPAAVRISPLNFGSVEAMVFCCDSCESILSIVLVAIHQQQPQQNRIIIPGREN